MSFKELPINIILHLLPYFPKKVWHVAMTRPFNRLRSMELNINSKQSWQSWKEEKMILWYTE